MDPSYNNPFDSLTQGGTNAPISSGTGDIVLSGGSDKKNSKGLVVLVVVMILIAVGLAVAYYMLGPGRKGQSSANHSAYSSEFNTFANYVLSGEEKTTQISFDGDDYSGTYFVSRMDNASESESARIAVIRRVGELFSDFKEKFENSDNKSQTDSVTEESEISDDGLSLGDVVDETGELINFMSVAYAKPEISYDSILKMYAKNGSETTTQTLGNYYDFSVLGENYYAEEFAGTLDYLVAQEIKLLDIYNENGCLVDGSLSAECVEGLDQGVKTDIDGVLEEVNYALSDLGYYYNLEDNLVTKTLAMNTIINGGGTE